MPSDRVIVLAEPPRSKYHDHPRFSTEPGAETVLPCRVASVGGQHGQRPPEGPLSNIAREIRAELVRANRRLSTRVTERFLDDNTPLERWSGDRRFSRRGCGAARMAAIPDG
jgi:hypothetical protein